MDVISLLFLEVKSQIRSQMNLAFCLPNIARGNAVMYTIGRYCFDKNDNAYKE